MMTPRSSCPGGESTPLRGANLRLIAKSIIYLKGLDGKVVLRPVHSASGARGALRLYGQIFNDFLALDRFVSDPWSMLSVPKRHSNFEVHRRQFARA